MAVELATVRRMDERVTRCTDVCAGLFAISTALFNCFSTLLNDSRVDRHQADPWMAVGSGSSAVGPRNSWALGLLHGRMKGGREALEIAQVVIEDIPKLVCVHGLISVDENIA